MSNPKVSSMTPKKKRSREQSQPASNDEVMPLEIPNEMTVEEGITQPKKSKRSKKSKESEEDNERHCTVKEIVSTEKIYVENLFNTIEYLIEPLRKILSNQDIQKLFGNISVIYNINETLCAQLEERTKNFNVRKTTIGDIFINIIPFLGVYSDYCCNYESAIQHYRHIKKTNPLFEQTIQSCVNNCKGYDMADLMIMPVQRIPRYKLLLEKLIKLTPESHPDYPLLTKAVSLVSDKATDINKKMNIATRQKKMMELHRKFLPSQHLEGGLVQPWRYYVIELNFKWIPSITSDPVDVLLFIFNDIFIIATKINEDELECKVAQPLWNSFLKKLESTWELAKLEKPPFQIVNPHGAWNLIPKDEETKNLFKTNFEMSRDSILSQYADKKYKRSTIKLFPNHEKQEWMAAEIAPNFSSNRVSMQILESETKEYTKKALQELLNENKEILESRPVKTPKKSRLVKIKDELSKALSPRRSSKKSKSTKPSNISETFDFENNENASQADFIRSRIAKLSEPKSPGKSSNNSPHATPSKKKSKHTPLKLSC